jgi:hypothetical protein
MNCAEFEVVLADYLDDSLAPGDRTALEQHAASCPGCREFMREAAGAVTFLKRVQSPLPPPELITRLAYLAPMGKTREPLEQRGFFSRLTSQWLQPVLRPRWAMGMAMTILSFSMLERCTGVRIQRIQPADLNPVRIWGGVEDKALRVKDRAVKYYENIRLVYEIETRLKDLQNQQDAAPSQTSQPSDNTDNGAKNAPQGSTKK